MPFECSVIPLILHILIDTYATSGYYVLRSTLLTLVYTPIIVKLDSLATSMC